MPKKKKLTKTEHALIEGRRVKVTGVRIDLTKPASKEENAKKDEGP